MRVHTKLLPGCALLALAAVTALTPAPAVHADEKADAKKYVIDLHRPMEVGQVLHVKTEGSLEVTSTPFFDGKRQPTQHVVTYVTLVADAKVEAVDSKGRPTRVAFAIEKCTRTHCRKFACPTGM